MNLEQLKQEYDRRADPSLPDDSLECGHQTDRPRCGLLMVYRGANTEFDPALKHAYDAALSTAAK